jgi:hypothetical protein
MEKRPPVNQKDVARFQRVESLLKAHSALFANQGTVAATWRTYRGKRLGPYFQLTYRDRGRQLWFYLGRSQELARRVKDLLAKLHRRRDQRRQSQKLQAQARASFRRAKNQLKKLLAVWGIQLKGFEFRGARQGLARYAEARALASPAKSKDPCPAVRPAPT